MRRRQALVNILLAVVLIGTGALIAASPDSAVKLVGAIVSVALFLVVLSLPTSTWRVGILLGLFVSNAAYWLKLPPGFFVAVLAIFIVRDLRLVVRGVRARNLWFLLLAMAFLCMLSPNRFGFGVVAGLLLYWYLIATKDSVEFGEVALIVAVGGAIGAGLNLLVGDQGYDTIVRGVFVHVERAVATGLDPNASASLLLIGFGAGLCVAVMRRERPLFRLIGAGAAGLIAASLAATGSRAGLLGLGIIIMVSAVARPSARASAKSVASRLARSRISLIVGPLVLVVVYMVLVGTELQSRLASVDVASTNRLTIWQEATGAATHGAKNLLLGVGPAPSESITSILAPHSSVLEILLTYGLLGLAIVLTALIAAGKSVHSAPVILRAAGLAVLIQSMTIGASSQFIPWIGLALLVGGSQRYVATVGKWKSRPTSGSALSSTTQAYQVAAQSKLSTN